MVAPQPTNSKVPSAVAIAFNNLAITFQTTQIATGGHRTAGCWFRKDLLLCCRIRDRRVRRIGLDRSDTIFHRAFTAVHLAFANGLAVGCSQHEKG